MNIENLKKGDWITVLSWEETSVQAFDPDTYLPVATEVKRRDNSYVGDLLEIVAIDPPFLAVIVDTYRDWDDFGPVTLDLRRCKVQKCSEEFVKALKTKAAKKGSH